MYLIILFALIAVSNAITIDKDCDKAFNQCINNLLVSKLSDNGIEENSTTLNDCYMNAVRKCTAGQDYEESCYFDSVGHKHCYNFGDSNDAVIRCLESHREYITACITETLVNAMEALGAPVFRKMDHNAISCAMFGVSLQCAMERAKEFCGEESSAIVRNEMISGSGNECIMANVVHLKAIEKRLVNYQKIITLKE